MFIRLGENLIHSKIQTFPGIFLEHIMLDSIVNCQVNEGYHKLKFPSLISGSIRAQNLQIVPCHMNHPCSSRTLHGTGFDSYGMARSVF